MVVVVVVVFCWFSQVLSRPPPEREGRNRQALTPVAALPR